MKRILYSIFLIAAAVLLPAPVLSAQGGDTTEGIHVTSYMTYDLSTNSGTYTTEAYVDGEIKTSLIEPPLDVIYVLDKSGATDASIGSLDAFEAIADLFYAFLDNLPQSDTKVAILGYDNGGTTSIADFTTIDATSLASLRSTIENMAHNKGAGSLSDPYGEAAVMFTAQDALNAGSGRKSKHIVVTFAGGSIGSGNASIAAAHTLKEDYGAIMVNALLDTQKDGGSDYTIMEYSSSNYPDAQSTSNSGTKNPNPIYYKFTNSYSAFESFFGSLAEVISQEMASIDLIETAVSRTVLGPTISLPADAVENGIKVYTSACTGVDGSGNCTFSSTRTQIYGTGASSVDSNISVTVNGLDVDVKGFNYSDNWCGLGKSGGPRGKKIIIEIPFTLSAPGTSVVVSTDDSGILKDSEEDTPLTTFPDQTLYLSKLEIKKSGLEEGESALFTVTGSSSTNLTIALQGASSGDVSTSVYLGVYDASAVYTVTEQTGWSWTYATTTASKAVAMSDYDPGETATVEFSNTKKDVTAKNAEDGKLNQLQPSTR